MSRSARQFSGLGALGAATVGSCALFFNTRVQSHLSDVPPPFQQDVSRFGNSVTAWAGVEFTSALMFIAALKPSIWTTLRWVLIPIVLVCCLATGVLLTAFLWKQWRDEDFRRFWAKLDLSG